MEEGGKKRGVSMEKKSNKLKRKSRRPKLLLGPTVPTRSLCPEAVIELPNYSTPIIHLRGQY